MFSEHPRPIRLDRMPTSNSDEAARDPGRAPRRASGGDPPLAVGAGRPGRGSGPNITLASSSTGPPRAAAVRPAGRSRPARRAGAAAFLAVPIERVADFEAGQATFAQTAAGSAGARCGRRQSHDRCRHRGGNRPPCWSDVPWAW